jgi:surfeit locus 1 family protein
MSKRRFNPGKRLTFFFVFFSISFFALGVWQIERGQAKSKILLAYEKAAVELPNKLSSGSFKWQRVVTKGYFDANNQVLLDNVINKGIAGYKVLTPLISEDTKKLLLVDRGWLPAGNDRGKLPKLDISKDEVKIFGTLESPELGFVLSENLITNSSPRVSQTKNIEVLQTAFDQELFPFILVAEPTLKDSLEYIKITPTNMTPAKHFGYAIQWFTMFLAICLMYLWAGRRNEQ